MYQIPMKQLRYRTVFDVDTSNDRSVLDAWREGTSEVKHPIVLVDPMALDRFHDTYFGIPALPGDVAGPRDQPFVLEKPEGEDLSHR